jgi:FAD/FMN-containing dehydrogenase
MPTLTDALTELQSGWQANSVLTTDGDKSGYERGMRYGNGRALCVLRPGNVDEVRHAVRWASEHGIKVVPQGANTGLVAGASPDESGRQVVLSFERLRDPPQIDVASRTALVSAGTRLSALNQSLAAHGLWFPIDLGADPTIGGMIAANTGGARLLRYGDVRRNLLGVEVVLADANATKLDLLGGTRKNNTGVDLKQLFVGTGGCFGIVTKAVLEVHPLPRQRAAALLVPARGVSPVDVLQAAESHFGELLCAFETMSAAALRCALAARKTLRNPFDGENFPEQTILIELAATAARSVAFDLEAALESFLEILLGDGTSGAIDNAVVGKPDELWALRHTISDSLRGRGRVIAFDVSVPRSRIEAFRVRAIETVRATAEFLEVCDFGHYGDGGLHFNLVWPNDSVPAYDETRVLRLRRAIYRVVVEEFAGSFSAEHGVGPYNFDIYREFTPQATQSLAADLHRLLNPRGLLGSVDYSALKTTP